MPRFLALGAAIAAVAAAFYAGRWSAAPVSAVIATPSRHPSAASAITACNRPNTSEPAAQLDLRTTIATARRVSHNFADDEAREGAIEKWAESDPRAALEFVRHELHGDQRAAALSAVLAAWGRSDPDAAWSWVTANEPAATHHFDTLLEVFGRTSTDTAARYATQYSREHPEAALEVHLAALLGITYRGDFAGARAFIDGDPALTTDARGTLLNFVAGQWARFSPDEAVAWVQTLPSGAARDQALLGLGESWSEQDPAHAAAFAATLPRGDVRTVALRQAIGKWVMVDADAARAWVVQVDRHEDFDQAVGAIATDANLVNRDPQRALRWAATIFDDTVRSQSVGAILASWYPNDPAAATQYLETVADLTPAQKTELLTRLRASHTNG